MKIGILFSDFGPYHIARIKALSDALDQEKSNLVAFRITKASTTYSWKPQDPLKVKIITLAEKKPKSLVATVRIAFRFYRELKLNNIKAVFLPSYSPIPNYLCYITAKSLGIKTIMMNESWSATAKTSKIGTFIKKNAVKGFDAALVGGIKQAEYAIKLGMPKNRVFLGYDVVDNDYYVQKSSRWRDEESTRLPIQGLPKRFFLNIGRFVHKKNLLTLVKSYCNLIKLYPDEEISLVLVGEGDQEIILKEYLISNCVKIRNGMDDIRLSKQEVVFYPFQQHELTPIFFSRCEAFILPSIYEEWGLVINEALSSSACVLVSNNVGSSFELVDEGVNGFTFDPNNQNQLNHLLTLFVQDNTLKERLSKNSQKTMKNWGLDKFGSNGVKALKSVFGSDINFNL